MEYRQEQEDDVYGGELPEEAYMESDFNSPVHAEADATVVAVVVAAADGSKANVCTLFLRPIKICKRICLCTCVRRCVG